MRKLLSSTQHSNVVASGLILKERMFRDCVVLPFPLEVKFTLKCLLLHFQMFFQTDFHSPREENSLNVSPQDRTS